MWILHAFVKKTEYCKWAVHFFHVCRACCRSIAWRHKVFFTLGRWTALTRIVRVQVLGVTPFLSVHMKTNERKIWQCKLAPRSPLGKADQQLLQRKIFCVHPFTLPKGNPLRRRWYGDGCVVCLVYASQRKLKKYFWQLLWEAAKSLGQLHLSSPVKKAPPKISGLCFRVRPSRWVPMVLRKDSKESTFSAEHPSIPKMNQWASAKKLAWA